MLRSYDIWTDSSIKIQTNRKEELWFYKNGKITTGKFTTYRKNGRPHSCLIAITHMNGFYEGSIFCGYRFDEYNMVD